jgi:hypothetical protein
MKKYSKTTTTTVAKRVAVLLCMCGLLFNMQASQAQCPTLGGFTGMSGDFSVCPGMTLTYTLNPVANATSYKWYLPPGATINGQNPYTTTSNVVTVNFGAFYASPGNLCVTATNGCVTSASYCKTLTAAGAPSGASTITGSIYACAGQTLTYSVTNTVNRIYDWTVPNNAVVLSGQGTSTVSVKFNAGFNGGNICVRVGNGCVYSAFRCMSLYASLPGTPLAITGPDNVCGGQTATFSTNAGNAVPVTTYTWSAPPGSVITGQGTNTVQITFASNYGSGNVAVKAGNGCGNSGDRVLLVRSTPPTPQPVTGIAAGICNGTTPYAVQPDPYAIAYNWTLTGPGTITSGQGSSNVNVNYPPSFVSGKICVTITNNCATSGARCVNTSKNVDIAKDPTPTVSCNGTSAMFTVKGVGMNLQYQWRKNGVPLVNGGHISGADKDTLLFTPADSLDAANYDVIVSTTCSSQKTSQTAGLAIKQVPVKPAAISGASPVTCPGTTGVVYSVPLQADATGFSWGASQGVEILNGQGTDAVVLKFDSTTNSGYRVYVFGTNECGIGHDSSSSWTRFSISTPTITGQARVCNNLSGITYSTQLIQGANNYNWNVPAGATLVSGQGTNSISVNFGAGYTGGDVTVAASNICYTTPVKKFATVIDVPGTPTSLSGQLFGTCNTQLSYAAGNSNYASSYSWTLPPNATISSGAGTNNVGINFANPGNGTYSLCVAGSNYCRTGAQRCITVRGVPEKPAAINANPTSFCANQSGVQFSTPGGIGTNIYNWLLPSGSIITTGQGTTSIVANMGSANGNVVVTGSNACGSSGSRTLPTNMNCREAGDELNGNAHAIKIFPNPADDMVKISFNAKDQASYNITVYDILGKKVVAEGGITKVGLNEHTVNVTKLTKGIYIVALENIDGSAKLKLEVK